MNGDQMAKFLAIICDWTGGDTRGDAASLTAITQGAAQFDTGFGVGYVVRPGGGTTGNDAELLKSITLTPNKLEILWNSTGGQNHTIKVKFVDDGNTGYSVDSAGPKNHTPNQIIGSITDNIGE
jgi:hypothetical protein